MILLSDVIDHYQKDLEMTHSHEMLPSHHQALRVMRRCGDAGGKAVITCCSNANPVQADSEFPILVDIEVVLTANIAIASNGSRVKPQSCCRSPILWLLLHFLHNYGIHSGSIRNRCMIC
jgi:hypothetical protein